MAALVGIPSDCEGPFSFLLLFVTILLCDFGSQTQFRRNFVNCNGSLPIRLYYDGS